MPLADTRGYFVSHARLRQVRERCYECAQAGERMSAQCARAVCRRHYLLRLSKC